MVISNDEIKRRLIELMFIDLDRGLSDEEKIEWRALSAGADGFVTEEESMGPDWFRKNYRLFENIDKSKEAAWKKLWGVIERDTGK